MTFDERLAYTAANKNTWVKLIKQKQSQKEGNCNADVQKRTETVSLPWCFSICDWLWNRKFLLAVTRDRLFFKNELSLYKRYSNVYRTNFLSVFITPSLLGFSVGILGFLLGLLMYVRDNDRGIYRHGEEYGSARFATPAEMKKYEDQFLKTILLLVSM